MAKISVEYIDHMGSDKTVVNAARVSFNKDSTKYTADQNARLITYLGEHRHTSPFGHAFASFRVKAPIFVARQLVKHKFLRINEVSRRYVDDEPEFYVPQSWRGRSADKKQGSEGVATFDQDGDGEVDYYNKHALAVYTNMLASNVAPEQARMVLPQSMITEWYWSGSLDAFADMCNLRCKEDTQFESRLVADKIDYEMGWLFPLSWKALRKDE